MTEKSTEKIVKSFIKQTKSLFPIYNSQIKTFLSDLQNSMFDFASDNNVTYEQLGTHFGSPQEIVFNYLTEMPEENLSKCLSLKRTIKICIITALAVFIIAAAVFSVSYYKAFKAAEDAVISQEIITIEEIE